MNNLKTKIGHDVDFVGLGEGGKRVTRVYEPKSKIKMRSRGRFFVNCYHTPETGNQKNLIEALATNRTVRDVEAKEKDKTKNKFDALNYSTKLRNLVEFVEVMDE